MSGETEVMGQKLVQAPTFFTTNPAKTSPGIEVRSPKEILKITNDNFDSTQ
jgi:hypothetical protein